MPLILLIRHGENEYVKTGRMAGRLPHVHLNERGKGQAHTLADRLSGSPVKAIYSSPMERAMETAEPIAGALGLEVIIRPGLIEVDIGEWQDQKLKALSRLKQWKNVQNRPSMFRFPGGETFVEAQNRIVTELNSLAEKHEQKDLVICVSHADPIKLAAAFYTGMPLDAFQNLSVSTASITAIFLGEGQSRLITLNYDFSFTLPKL